MILIHKCKYCDYESPYRANNRRHAKNKHANEETFFYQHANVNQSWIGVQPTPANEEEKLSDVLMFLLILEKHSNT